jgi:hypothetical protein
MAEDLSVKVLSRAWQMLLKGLDELSRAPKPLIAAEMILVRLCYVADLPTPDEAIKALGEGPSTPASAPQPSAPSTPNGGGSRASLALAPQSEAPAPQPQAKTNPPPVAVALRDLDALIALAEKNNNRALPPLIRAYIRPVSFGENQLEIGLAAGAPQAFVGDLAEALKSWTGARWMISVNSQADAQTLNELAAEREVAKKADASQHPTVQAILQAFPGATITGVRSIKPQDDVVEDAAEAPDIDDTPRCCLRSPRASLCRRASTCRSGSSPDPGLLRVRLVRRDVSPLTRLQPLETVAEAGSMGPSCPSPGREGRQSQIGCLAPLYQPPVQVRSIRKDRPGSDTPAKTRS